MGAGQRLIRRGEVYWATYVFPHEQGTGGRVGSLLEACPEPAEGWAPAREATRADRASG